MCANVRMIIKDEAGAWVKSSYVCNFVEGESSSIGFADVVACYRNVNITRV